MEYLNLLSELLKIKSDNPIVVAIDGPAGSGKTTLAQKLVKDLSDAQVIHMDDLYDGWNDPLSAKLTSRVISQLFEPFTMQLPVRYQCFNWKLNRFDVMKSVYQSKYFHTRPNYILQLESGRRLYIIRTKSATHIQQQR